MGAEQRLKELGIRLPSPPDSEADGHVDAVLTGNLLFLSGMLPVEDQGARFIGRIGAELDLEAGRSAARLAALNALAAARHQLGSIDKISHVVRLGVFIVTAGTHGDESVIADAAAELLEDIFGKDKYPSRLVLSVASLPLGVPVQLELIFEVGG